MESKISYLGNVLRRLNERIDIKCLNGDVAPRDCMLVTRGWSGDDDDDANDNDVHQVAIICW